MRHSPSDLAAQLRFVDIADCDASTIEQLRRLRNDPQIRRYLYTTHEISAGEHEQWVRSVAGDNMRRVFAVLLANDMAGSVNWSSCDMDEGTVSWGFYVNPRLAGQGIGTAMLTRFIAMIFADPAVSHIRGEALVDNAASLALHKRVGFVEQGRKTVRIDGDGENTEAVVFALDRQS